MITAHVLALGIALVIYALPHHVIPREDIAIGTISTRNGTAGTIVSVPENTPEIAGSTVGSDEAEGATVALEPDVISTDYPEMDNIENFSEPTIAETQPEPTTTLVGYFKDRFADLFNGDDSITNTEVLYRSGNVEITISSGYDTTFSSQYWRISIFPI